MNKKIGDLGEKLSQKYLLDQGYKILTSNYRTKFGEIDLIVEERGLIIFIEVKTRTSGKFGRPMESVDYRKRETITRVAQYYMVSKGIGDLPIRFDVIEVYMDVGNKKYKLNHLENAF